MKFVIQRVTHAKVEVEQKIIGSIQNGYLVLIGIAEDDNEEIADKLVKKLLGLRILQMRMAMNKFKSKGCKWIPLVSFTIYIICRLS